MIPALSGRVRSTSSPALIESATFTRFLVKRFVFMTAAAPLMNSRHAVGCRSKVLQQAFAICSRHCECPAAGFF